MKTTELRIGNYVLNNKNVPIRVESISDIGINLEIDDYGHCPQNYWTLEKDINPMPLTDEWMKKFNFSVNKNDKSVFQDDNVYDGYSTGFYFSTKNKIFYFMESSLYSAVKIEYVHQFQNWYHCFTGKDLKRILVIQKKD